MHNRATTEKEKKRKAWQGKIRKRKVGKAGFLQRIRKEVFERDGYQCVWCGTKEKLGLGPLIPESRGGKREKDNFVCTCQHCRPSKGNKLPLEFIDGPIRIEVYLQDCFEHSVRLHKPDHQVKINLYLVAELSHFLKKIITTTGEVDKSKAERLLIKLTE